MGLREEHRELTRRTVLGAVLDLVAEGALDELSVPAVARRSGVSVATIYRYFPSKDALLAAAAAEPSRRAREAAGSRANGDKGDELAAFLRTMWSEFAGNLPLLRHQLSSAAGRDMRQARLDESRRRLATYLDDAGVDPESPVGGRLTALILLLTGSVALVELHDRQGLDLDVAIDAALWGVQALVAASVRDAAEHREERP